MKQVICSCMLCLYVINVMIGINAFDTTKNHSKETFKDVSGPSVVYAKHDFSGGGSWYRIKDPYSEDSKKPLVLRKVA